MITYYSVIVTMSLPYLVPFPKLLSLIYQNLNKSHNPENRVIHCAYNSTHHIQFVYQIRI